MCGWSTHAVKQVTTPEAVWSWENGTVSKLKPFLPNVLWSQLKSPDLVLGK